MTAPGRAGVLATALLATGCGARLMNLPPGPGMPAADGVEAVAEATAACAKISTVVSEVAASGRVAGQRLRARLLVGLASPRSARLEAIAPFGQPLFIFVSRDGTATLLLTRENRVLRHDAPGDVLEAIAGVPLDPAALRHVVTGCAADARPAQAREIGSQWRVVPAGGHEVYLHRDGGNEPWRLVAAVHRDPSAGPWRAEYRDFERGFPRTIRLVSERGERFDLRLRVSDLDLDVPLGPEAFEVNVPASADPITIDELRRSGPLAEPAAASAAPPPAAPGDAR